MPLKIAPCGIDCNECEAYIATQANNSEQLTAVAEKWSAEFDGDISPENCICDGCTSGGRLSTAHANQCGLRVCAAEKGFPTCAHCPDYRCELLQQFVAFAPELGKKLDIIRDGLEE